MLSFARARRFEWEGEVGTAFQRCWNENSAGDWTGSRAKSTRAALALSLEQTQHQ